MVIIPVLDPKSLKRVLVPIHRRFEGFMFEMPTLLNVWMDVKYPTLATTFPLTTMMFEPNSVKYVFAPTLRRLRGFVFPIPTLLPGFVMIAVAPVKLMACEAVLPLPRAC